MREQNVVQQSAVVAKEILECYTAHSKKRVNELSNLLRIAIVVVTVSMALPIAAQWPAYPTPGVPRTPDGKPNLAAPTPRTADGKPDLSGV